MRTWYFGPPRSWKWTRRTVVVAAVFFCVLYVEGYRNWSAVEHGQPEIEGYSREYDVFL